MTCTLYTLLILLCIGVRCIDLHPPLIRCLPPLCLEFKGEHLVANQIQQRSLSPALLLSWFQVAFYVVVLHLSFLSVVQQYDDRHSGKDTKRTSVDMLPCGVGFGGDVLPNNKAIVSMFEGNINRVSV